MGTKQSTGYLAADKLDTKTAIPLFSNRYIVYPTDTNLKGLLNLLKDKLRVLSLVQTSEAKLQVPQLRSNA